MKMMKKNKKTKNTFVKIRRTWDMNPVERIKQSKKAYSRNREKRTIKKIVKEDF